MRSAHYLRANDKLRYPKHLIFIDTETTTIKDDEEIHEPSLILGCAQFIVIGDDAEPSFFEQLVFRDLETLWKFIFSHNQEGVELFIYAHNWSFDFPIINGFYHMHGEGYQLLSIVDASPPIILRYSKPHLKITFIDTLNYFKLSLAKIGKSLGAPKIEINLHKCTDDDLEKYCIQDTTIIRTAIVGLITFLHSNDLAGLSHTTSSLALSVFARRFMTRKIAIDANEKRSFMGRAAYFGGRTECFRMGKYIGNYYLIDVNSQYPFVMRNNKFPTSTFTSHKNISVDDLEDVIYKYCVVAECSIETDIPVYPYKIDDRTCFPVGSFRTSLSTPEIIYGLENDLIKKVHSVVLYHSANIFRDYVDYFYTKRLEYKRDKNEMYQLFCKLLMNSLYGKFGQRGLSWEETKVEPRGYPGKWVEFNIDTGKRESFMEIGGKVFISEKEQESHNSFPAIAAHVTAYGRLIIQRTIDYIGSKHVYYCDTDSLVIDQTGYDKMKDKLHDKALGCWALEGTYNKIHIKGAKDYIFGKKVKIKGIKKKHVVTNEGLFRQLQFSSLRGSIRTGCLTHPVITHVEKNLTRTYKKGHVLPDGSITPFKLDNGELVSPSDD